MTSLCQEFHCLPDEGGLLDQEYITMRKVGMVLEAQAEKRKKEEEEQQRKVKRASKSKK